MKNVITNTAIFLCSVLPMFAQQYVWQQKTSIPSLGRHAPVGFELNGKTYFGMGEDLNYLTYSDLWEYNIATDSWTQKAALPGQSRVGAFSFEINGQGYVSCGFTNSSGGFGLNDTWKYDPINNSWTQVAQFPGSGRYLGGTFVINNKAYVGTGYNPYLSDFYEYDAATNSWAAKSSYPIAIQSPASFSLNGKGYFVGGNNSNTLNSVYQYDPNTNIWTPKNNFPISVTGAIAFVVNNIPYVGMGIAQLSPSVSYSDKIYSYDDVNDSWTLVDTFPSVSRSSCVAITIGSDSYVFGGNFYNGAVNPFSELWKFTSTVSGCSLTVNTQPLDQAVNTGGNAQFTVTSSDPNASYQWQTDFGLGYQNLVDVGQYSGSATSTLNVNNAQLKNHTQPFQVIASSGSCYDTSTVATLSITDTCIVIDTNYISVTDTLIIDATLTGIPAPNNINTIRIYPNPAATHIFIDNGNYVSMAGYTVRIENTLGQTVFQNTINQQQFLVDLSGWTGNGTYFVYIIDNLSNTIEVRKIIVQ